MIQDPATKRFLAMLLAPVFLLLKGKLGIDVPESVQDLLIVSIMLYVGGSHWKSAVIAKAEAAVTAAAATVTPATARTVLETAASDEAKTKVYPAAPPADRL
jgi:hypothetical protein